MDNYTQKNRKEGEVILWDRRIAKYMMIIVMSIVVASSSITAQAAVVPGQKIVIHQVPLNFLVNGQVYATPDKQKGFIFANSTYVPLRFAAYAFNQAVSWDGPTGTVRVSQPTDGEKIAINAYNQTNKLQLSQLAAAPEKTKSLTWNVSLRTINYLFYDNVKSPSEDKPGILYDGTLYVPIRFFGESLGVDIDYDQKSLTVSAILLPSDAGSLIDSNLIGDVATNNGSPSGTQSGSQGTPGQGNGGTPVTQTPKPGDSTIEGEEIPVGDDEPGTDIPVVTPPDGTTPVVTPPDGTTPVVTPPDGTTPVVTPPVVTPPKKTASAITRATETSISRLRASCTNRITVVYLQYLNATNIDQQLAAYNSGNAILSDCDSSFDNLMNSYSQEMSQNGHAYTQAVASYRATYEAEKQANMKSIGL